MRASEWPRPESMPASISRRRRVELVRKQVTLLRLAGGGNTRLAALADEASVALLERGRQHFRGDAAIRPDRDMLFSGDLDHVLEVADHVRRRRLPALAQEGHEINARHAPLLRHGAQLRVRAIARVIVLCRTARMRERHWFPGRLDGVRCRLAAAVAEVDEDPEVVHLLDRLDARLAEARVRGLEASIPEKVAAIVRGLHDAKAEPIQLIEPDRSVSKATAS
jgi:hypothetical protein